MKKISYLTIVILLCSFSLFAQNQQTSYHAANGKVVETREESHYYRIISIDEQHPDLRKYEEYYSKDDRLKLSTYLTNGRTTGSKIGECRTFYPNGQLQEKLRYDSSHRLIDTAYSYYRNGNLYASKLYKPASPSSPTPTSFYTNHNESDQAQIEYILVQDSLGKVLVRDGTGMLPIFNLSNWNVQEQGPIKNNKKNGEWSGKINKRTFVESWENDSLINGVTKDSLGVETAYNAQNFAVPPEYPGGITALRTFVGQNYQYPAEALQEGVSGMIQIDFIVEPDGSMTNFTIRKDLGHGTGQAGVNAIRRAKRQWTPGIQRGIPVRVAYTLPIMLAVSP